MNEEIRLTKLKYLDSKSIFDWLESEYSQNKYNYDNKLIESTLAEKNDSLINLGLLLYGKETEVLLKIYNETDDIGLKIAYLNSESFQYGDGGDILNDLLRYYQKEQPERNEKLLVAFFTNPSLSNNILTNLFKKEGLFKSFENDIWLKLISFTDGNKRLNAPYKEEYMDYIGEYSYETVFIAFGKLYEKLDVTIENGRLLNNLACEMVSKEFDIDINGCLERWQSEDNSSKKVFEDCRYYIAKLHHSSDLRKYKDSYDKALRRAYYSSNFCSSLSNKEEELYKILEAYFDKDGNDFIEEVLHHNSSMFVNKIRRTALSEVCWYADKDGFFTNRFNQIYDYYLNNFPQWFEDEDNESNNYIENIQNKELRTEQCLKKIYENVSVKDDSDLKKELEQINEDIQSFKHSLDNNLVVTQNTLRNSVSLGVKTSMFIGGLFVGIIIRSFF